MYMVTMDFSHGTTGPEVARPVTWEVWSVRQAILMVSFSPTGSYSLIKECCSTSGGASIAHKHSRLPPPPWCLSSSPLPWGCASPNTGVTECQSLLTILNLNIHLSKWFSYWHKLEINEFFFYFLIFTKSVLHVCLPVHRDLLLSPLLLTLADAVSSTCNWSLFVSNCGLNNSQRCYKQCEA